MRLSIRSLGILFGFAAALFLGALWLRSERASPAATTAQLEPAVVAMPSPSPMPPATATPLPTATPSPAPTPTPIPLPVLFGTLVEPDLRGELVSPLRCDAIVDAAPDTNGVLPVQCPGPIGAEPVSVLPAAPGRIAHIVRQPSTQVEDPSGGRHWSWASQAALGPHVVVDHGPLGTTSSVQTLYSLAGIEQTLRLGEVVDADTPLGQTDASGTVGFSVWADGVRQDGLDGLVSEAPPIDRQLEVARALGAAIMSPTDPDCPLILWDGSLPSAPRTYRNGTHRGIDFGCAGAGHFSTAIADGTVVYLVDDYDDPTPNDRQALLNTAALAGRTPHWTLAMLYGNVVVVDHGIVDGAGHVVTISAHLEQVDPGITLGAPVVAGQVLGEIGNRGTLASAQGVRGADDPTLHLHWELYVDGWFLGQGLTTGEVRQVIDASMCGVNPTPGC